MRPIITFLFSLGIAANLLAQPVIRSFSPIKGAIGSTVTITGTNFNTTPAQNIVFFGATKATVNTATATSLTVTVPLGTTYQYISVTNLAKGLTAYSARPFIVTLQRGGGINFATVTDAATGLNPSSISIGDMDGDGKADLVITNAGSNTVSVLRNTSKSGTISFASKIDFATFARPYSPYSLNIGSIDCVSIGDIDGDGKLDLAVTNGGANKISVLRNTSTPGIISFAAKVDLTTGTGSRSVIIADIDGDGKPDLAVANAGGGTVSVLSNTSSPGNISFAGKVDFITGNSPFSMSIGDIDGDGKPDLMVANYADNTVSVLLNTSKSGTVSFAKKVDFVTGSQPVSVSIADIDGDRKPDLVLANSNNNGKVSILFNTSTPGSVNFSPSVILAKPNQPTSVSIGDMDGDGKLDLAVVSADNIVSVFRGLGGGSFENTTNLPKGTFVVLAVSICDLDGDGNPDIAVVNMNRNTVSVLRQIAPLTHRINEGSITKLAPIEEQAHFVISPNPVESNCISVQLKNQPAGRYTLRLVNNIGQTVFTRLLQHSGGNSTQIINLPVGTVKGMYQAKLYGVNGGVGTQTILINTKN